MNKFNLKNLFRIFVAALLVILAISTMVLPLVTAKVNVTEDGSKPDNFKVNLSALSAYNIRRTIAEVESAGEDAIDEFEDLTEKEQIRYVYFQSFSLDGLSYLDDIEDISSASEITSIADSIVNPVTGMSTVKKSVYFTILFLLCAVLVAVIANKTAFGLAISSVMLYLFNIVGSAVSRVGLTHRTLYFNTKEYAFYDFSSSLGYYVEILFIIIIVVASAFAISLSIQNKKAVAAAAPMPAPVHTPAPAPVSVPAGGGYRPAPAVNAVRHQLTCVEGEFRNATFAVEAGDQIVIGRDSNVANIVVVAPKISRKHCTIRFDKMGNCYYVTDFSTNGTFTVHNGARLIHGSEVCVPCGTVIALGNNDNQFRLD